MDTEHHGRSSHQTCNIRVNESSPNWTTEHWLSTLAWTMMPTTIFLCLPWQSWETMVVKNCVDCRLITGKKQHRSQQEGERMMAEFFIFGFYLCFGLHLLTPGFSGSWATLTVCHLISGRYHTVYRTFVSANILPVVAGNKADKSSEKETKQYICRL